MEMEQFEKAEEIVREIKNLEEILKMYNKDTIRFYAGTIVYKECFDCELSKSIIEDLIEIIKKRINSLKTELEQL